MDKKPRDPRVETALRTYQNSLVALEGALESMKRSTERAAKDMDRLQQAMREAQSHLRKDMEEVEKDLELWGLDSSPQMSYKDMLPKPVKPIAPKHHQ